MQQHGFAIAIGWIVSSLLVLAGCEEATLPVSDTAPRFTEEVADQTYTTGEAIAPLVLPEATGGDGALSYTLEPAVPGLRFDGGRRRLTGAPTSTGSRRMTYRAVDADGNTAASDAAVLKFTIVVQDAEPPDTAPRFTEEVADQTYTTEEAIAPLVLPEATGGNGALSYTLEPAVPGLTFEAGRRRLTGAPTSTGSRRMTYRAVDADGNTAAGDAAVLKFTIVVQDAEPPDTAPRFTAEVADQIYPAGEAIEPLVLPEATGGNGALSYTLEPAVPGLRFDGGRRRLTGAPTSTGSRQMTYRAVDADGNTAAGDTAVLRFTIVVQDAEPPDTAPRFTEEVADQTYTTGEAIASLVLPEATGGNGALSYTLEPTVPGLTFEAGTRRLTGTPTSTGSHRMTYRAVDADGNTAASDAAVVTFTITIHAAEPPDTAPRFTDGVADQIYPTGEAIAPLVLPEATGGNGALSYFLEPAVPGLGFDGGTRRLTGAPTSTGSHRMTYRAVDADGNTAVSDAAVLMFTITIHAAESQEDRAALVTLYNANDGSSWEWNTHWLSDRPIGEWWGVTTDYRGRVTELVFYLSGNNISDLSALARLTSLIRLELVEINHLPLEVSPLAGLTNLTRLNLSRNKISDLSPLAGLTSLIRLELVEIKGSLVQGAREYLPLDISPLAGLANLTRLNLSQNKISDLSPLAGLTNLTNLNLDVVNIVWGESDTSLDLSPLASLINLTELHLSYNSISESSPLAGLVKLTRLDISKNHISDISPLGNLTKLEYLDGHENQITDLYPLSGLTALQEVVLSVNDISDLAPLAENPGLDSGDKVAVRGNPLDATSISKHVPALQARGVSVSFDEVFVFTDPQIYNDNVFILPVSENLAPDHLPLNDYVARFYEHFDDEFDFLMFVPNFPPGRGSGAAAYVPIVNRVEGIGQSIGTRRSWSSARRLQGVVDFGGYSIYHDREWTILVEGPVTHELMHRWANFIIPPYGHWQFSSANGVLGGFDIANLVHHGGGRYTAGNFSLAGVADNVVPYSPIELYLAGFIPPQEVPDLWVAEDGEWLRDEEGRIVRADNGHMIFTASRVKTYTIDDVIAKHGPRIPDASQAQKEFRAAVVLLTDRNHPATREILETLSDDVAWFSHAGEDESRRYNFYEATGGRGTITMDGLSQFRK